MSVTVIGNKLQVEILADQSTKTQLNNIQQEVVGFNEAIDEVEAKKVNKTLTIIGLDLQDNILLGEFRTALGNATQSVAGLLSAADKTHLDVLVALLENSDGNNVVDTIGEILAIFNNYPEGADLVSALSGKVNKADIVDNLTTNDATKVLSAKQGKALEDNKEALTNKATNFSVVNDTKYPTTKAVKDLVDATVGDIDAILDSILGV